MLRKYLNQSGDTIVEVLIAMTVISTILAGAYASSNRALNATRQAQERSEATKIVESQLELLKVAAKDSNEAIFTNDVFCIDRVLDPSPVVDRQDFASTVTPGTFPTANADTLAYPAACIVTSGIPYSVSIVNTGAADNVFVVRARWDLPGGNGKGEVVMSYRVYP